MDLGIRRQFAEIGQGAIALVRGIGAFTRFSATALKATVSQPPPLDLLLEQMMAVGIHSLPLILAVSSFVGMNLALQGYFLFKEVGGASATGMLVGLACLREMGPIVVGSMVASKSGSDMAAHIGTMRMKSQIDALEVMSVDPYWYLVAPRFLAMVLMLPLLVVVADLVLISAATAVAVYQFHLNGALFWNDIFRFASLTDIFNGMVKGVAFGILISLLCCFQGFTSEPSPEGVGRATNRAIVSVTSLAVLVNLALSQVMYG